MRATYQFETEATLVDRRARRVRLGSGNLVERRAVLLYAFLDVDSYQLQEMPPRLAVVISCASGFPQPVQKPSFLRW